MQVERLANVERYESDVGSNFPVLTMIKSTSIWSILSLSLLLKVSCNNDSPFTYSTIQTGGSPSALRKQNAAPVRGLGNHVAFVKITGSACKSTFEKTTDRKLIMTAATSKNSDNSNKASPQKTMDFLKSIGKVGSSVTDTECLIGVDEGNAGGCTSSATSAVSVKFPENRQAASTSKRTTTFRSCTETGIIDDMTNDFPYTSTGSRWDIFTDQVMGGISTGNVSREVKYMGKDANILRGQVRLENNGGFIQMATNFAPFTTAAADGAPSLHNSFRTATPIDASKFSGIELDVHCDVADTFNVHLKSIDCTRPQISYRATFETPKADTQPSWTSVQIPFSQFHGHNIDLPLDLSKLTRIGIVAIGREMQNVQLAVSSIRFF